MDAVNKDSGAIQSFNLEGLKTVLGVHENAGHNEALDEFNNLEAKCDQDLAEGFTVWVNENDLGSTVCYNGGAKGTEFYFHKTLIDGKPVRRALSGRYQIQGHEVTIDVDQETNSPFVTCYVFLDGGIVATRTSPFDTSNHQAQAFVRSLHEDRGDDSALLDKTISDERSPYPFIMKMLRDFSRSKFDRRKTEQMFKKMSTKERVVRWNQEYRA